MGAGLGRRPDSLARRRTRPTSRGRFAGARPRGRTRLERRRHTRIARSNSGRRTPTSNAKLTAGRDLPTRPPRRAHPGVSPSHRLRRDANNGALQAKTHVVRRDLRPAAWPCSRIPVDAELADDIDVRKSSFGHLGAQRYDITRCHACCARGPLSASAPELSRYPGSVTTATFAGRGAALVFPETRPLSLRKFPSSWAARGELRPS